MQLNTICFNQQHMRLEPLARDTSYPLIVGGARISCSEGSKSPFTKPQLVFHPSCLDINETWKGDID